MQALSVEADNLIAAARSELDNIPIDPYPQEGIRRTRRIPLTCVTPELEKLFGNLSKTALLETDQEARIAGLENEEFKLYGQHIEDAIQALVSMCL